MRGSQRLLLVTGTGRSGTSTMAGALGRLGLLVPEPLVPPDETNPRGFYEPQWVVDLHKRLLNEIPVRTNDARPEALSLSTAATEDRALVDLVAGWLGEHARGAGGRDLVVKDPRTMWFTSLWQRAAESQGLRLCFVTMIRDPLEVARSRDANYLTERSDEFRALRQTANIASWVNGAVVTEQATRGRPRAFVRYADLLGDWRSTVERVAAQLDLAYPVPPVGGRPHPVDDFIEPRLSRSRLTWEEANVWPELQELASAAWTALDRLADDPVDGEAGRRLQDVGGRYTDAHTYARAVTLDHTNVTVQQARQQLRRKLTGGPGGDATGPGNRRAAPQAGPTRATGGLAGRARSVLGRLRRRVRG